MIILPINHHQIIQQLRKIIIVETKCESTFYEILGTYTGAIVIGLRNHKVVLQKIKRTTTFYGKIRFHGVIYTNECKLPCL